jgi:hypothetical protein
MDFHIVSQDCCFFVIAAFFMQKTINVEIIHRNVSRNCIAVNLWFILAWPYRLKHLKESIQHSYSQKKLVSVCNTPSLFG